MLGWNHYAINFWQATTRIVIPLGQLREGAEQLRLGQLEAAHPVSGRDEIGVLGDSLNSMAAQLEQRIRAEQDARELLKKLNLELEERVARRDTRPGSFPTRA